jgi:tripartite-type tricarboxylate transporter receptor subunit TctC
MKKVLLSILCLVLATGSVFASGAAEKSPETFPSRNIDLIVPFGAGGGTDALARKMAEIVRTQSGINMIVQNKTGGSGAVGMGEGAVARKDGYTVTMTTVEVVLLPAAGLASFKPSDFQGIIRINFDAAALVVRADNPANTLQEYVANAKKATRPVTLNVSAFPTNYWLCGAMLKEQSGANINLIEEPSGAAQQIANMLGGHVDGIVCTMAEAAAYVANGDFKFIAVASNERNPNYPNVPTFKEQGFNIEVGTWRGFMVPAGTDGAIVSKLEKAFTDAYNSEEFQTFLKTMGFGTGYLNSADFAKLVADQTAKYTPIIAQYI